MRPSARKRTRSAISAACASCVTITIVCPSSSAEARKSSRISPPVFESRLPVGSSANTTVGWETSARAIATRCCWPPDSSDGRCRRRSVRPTRSSRFSKNDRVGLLAGDRQRQRHVLLGGQHRQEVEELEDEADVLAAQQRHVAVGERPDVLTRDPDRPAGRLVERRKEVHQGGFARTGGAHHGDELAGLHVEGDPLQRVDRSLALAVAAGDVDRAHDRRLSSCARGYRPLRRRRHRVRP